MHRLQYKINTAKINLGWSDAINSIVNAPTRNIAKAIAKTTIVKTFFISI